MDMDLLVLVRVTSGNFELGPLLDTLGVQRTHLYCSTLLYQNDTEEEEDVNGVFYPKPPTHIASDTFT